MKNFPLQTFFYNLCTSANIFFSICKLFFLHISCLQAIYVVFYGPSLSCQRLSILSSRCSLLGHEIKKEREIPSITLRFFIAYSIVAMHRRDSLFHCENLPGYYGHQPPTNNSCSLHHPPAGEGGRGHSVYFWVRVCRWDFAAVGKSAAHGLV